MKWYNVCCFILSGIDAGDMCMLCAILVVVAKGNSLVEDFKGSDPECADIHYIKDTVKRNTQDLIGRIYTRGKCFPLYFLGPGSLNLYFITLQFTFRDNMPEV